MNQEERIDILLNDLKEDSIRYKNLEVSNDLEEKKLLIRSLMNVRMPRSINANLLTLQDDYLQEELKNKGIVNFNNILTIKDRIQSNHKYNNIISIWQGDITTLQIGAIVNAANSQMLGCFVPCHRCIDNAIHSSAGMQLREECNHIMNQKKIQYGRSYEEPTGKAILTSAYNLPCDYVIHTVGPIVYGRLNNSLRNDLKNCYESVLQCCKDHHIRSVAFCCISTGEFHFPNEEACKIAVDTVTKFLDNNKDSFDRIIFNVFKDLDKQLYENYLR